GEPRVAGGRWRPGGGAAGRVADAADLCTRDPQLAARGHFVEVPTAEGRTVRLDGPAFLLSDTPARVRGPGPLLGEHTDQVLRAVLGLGADEIAALRADGGVAWTPVADRGRLGCTSAGRAGKVGGMTAHNRAVVSVIGRDQKGVVAR